MLCKEITDIGLEFVPMVYISPNTNDMYYGLYTLNRIYGPSVTKLNLYKYELREYRAYESKPFSEISKSIKCDFGGTFISEKPIPDDQLYYECGELDDYPFLISEEYYNSDYSISSIERFMKATGFGSPSFGKIPFLVRYMNQGDCMVGVYSPTEDSSVSFELTSHAQISYTDIVDVLPLVDVAALMHMLFDMEGTDSPLVVLPYNELHDVITKLKLFEEEVCAHHTLYKTEEEVKE